MRKKWLIVFASFFLFVILSTVVFAADPIKLIVNGKEIKPDVAPQLINGRTMVPIRWVAEALGADVKWGAENQQVIVQNLGNSGIVNINQSDETTPDKEEFLNSPNGHAFQVTAWKFAKAYLSGDTSTMKEFLSDPDNKNNHYFTENKFDDVEFLILKLSPKNIKEDSVIAEYEFQLKGDDYYQYLQLEMKYINGKWKVDFYGLQM